MDFRTLKDIPDLAGKRVLVRLDLNVPIEKGAVVDDFRIRKALPTLHHLSKAGAKVLAVSHIESEEGTLGPVADLLREHLPLFSFSSELFGVMADGMRAGMQEGEVTLYENIRRYPEEESNDADFTQKLAGLAEMYVNDAFAVSHRKHASVVGVAKYLPSYAGLQLEEEVRNLSEAFTPLRPFVFVLGGAKFDTKIPLLEKFLDIADAVVVGGAVANVLLAEKGFPVGKSLVTKEDFGQKKISSHDKLILPSDVTVATLDGAKMYKEAANVGPDDNIVDIGPTALRRMEAEIREAKFVLWNGPVGFYESGYIEGTESAARMVATVNGKTVVGGGDTLAAIKKLMIEDKFSFVSTGGGAMLDFLAAGTLPGIDALNFS